MDCRVVRIFRKHNFAWGGNFINPDGMHFEWVGERRDQLPYPSRYCANVVSINSSTASNDEPAFEEAGFDEFFADDGWHLAEEDEHVAGITAGS
jgi:hypothetical protein